jgi:exonuclease III
MKTAAWNVNPIRKRPDRVIARLGFQHPNVLCMRGNRDETERIPFHKEAAMYRGTDTAASQA